ncbi:hypothetical protein [Pedobacter antarcticus]|uniref:hypothetical protein n=1 Tax=Pedobacter antarcticus TaxID=34086 RepID=UPI002930B07A|nr:hypothetical protein [Pedobacter antarcticus]
MKASDLRIGNYVGNGKVTMTNLENVEFSQGLYTVVENLSVKRSDEDEILPILINEEWLLKFGFNWCESKIIGKDRKLSIQVSNNEDLDYEDQEFFISNVSDNRVFSFWYEIKYVHQLQNLFFALTGEELEFEK